MGKSRELSASLGCLLIERGRRDDGTPIDLLTFDSILVWSSDDPGIAMNEALALWLADGVPAIDLRGEMA